MIYAGYIQPRNLYKNSAQVDMHKKPASVAIMYINSERISIACKDLAYMTVVFNKFTVNVASGLLLTI